MSDLDLDELRAELDDYAQPEKKGGRSAREDRIIAGFEDIQRFAETHGRAPHHGEDGDIFERLYAIRLDRLRELEECRTLLTQLDHQGLLGGGAIFAAAPVEAMDDDALLAELEGKDPARLEQFRKEYDALASEYFEDNLIRQDFLMTRATKI